MLNGSARSPQSMAWLLVAASSLSLNCALASQTCTDRLHSKKRCKGFLLHMPVTSCTEGAKPRSGCIEDQKACELPGLAGLERHTCHRLHEREGKLWLHCCPQ